MLSGLANYLFGGEKSDATVNSECSFDYNTREDDDEWLLIDVAEKEPTEKNRKENTTDFTMITSPSILPTSLSVLTVHLPDHRAFPSPPRSPSQMEGSWYVTPPPCFTAGGPIQVEMSPLENLLIEHPSMSVYTSTPPSSLSTNALVKELNCELVSSKSQDKVEIKEKPQESISVHIIVEKKSKTNQTTTRKMHHQPAFPIIRTDLIEKIANIKYGQKARHYLEQKSLHQSKLDRQNRTNHYHHSAKNLRRKDHWRHHSGANNNRKC